MEENYCAVQILLQSRRLQLLKATEVMDSGSDSYVYIPFGLSQISWVFLLRVWAPCLLLPKLNSSIFPMLPEFHHPLSNSRGHKTATKLRMRQFLSSNTDLLDLQWSCALGKQNDRSWCHLELLHGPRQWGIYTFTLFLVLI